MNGRPQFKKVEKELTAWKIEGELPSGKKEHGQSSTRMGRVSANENKKRINLIPTV